LQNPEDFDSFEEKSIMVTDLLASVFFNKNDKCGSICVISA
jgi:hypothetical protein